MPVSPEIGHEVAEKLFAAERAIDEAIRASAELTALLPNAAQRCSLSFGYIQSPMAALAAAGLDLTKARENTVEVHRSLEAIQRKTGLGAVAFGPFVDKDAPSGRLHAVTTPKAA